MQDEKQSYKDVLRAEVEEFIASTNEALEFDELFESAYAVALRSWKNGLAAGQKRASRGSGNRRYRKGALREAKSALRGPGMRKSKFTEEQIVAALKELEAGVTAQDSALVLFAWRSELRDPPLQFCAPERVFSPFCARSAALAQPGL